MPATGKVTETGVGGAIIVTDEAGESYTFPAPSHDPVLLDIDPRIDLTKPIYEQAQRLWAIDQIEESAAVLMESIGPHLTAEDDAAIWQEVLRTVLMDIETLGAASELPEKKFIKIGLCSHWMRPHKSRWTAAGGFAWPSGWHGVSGFSRLGLPELDWSVVFETAGEGWQKAAKFSGKRRLEVRVAVPARTARHPQAAIHTLWSPSNQRTFYGFRQKDESWKLAARSDFYGEDV
jgi:hypothetical protein